MNKFYTPPTQHTTLLYPKTKSGNPIYFNTRLSEFMKKYYSIFILTFLVFFGGNNNIFGATYSHTIGASTFTTSPQTKTLSSVDWLLTNNGGYYGYDATKGQQIGSSGSPASSMALSTSGISGTITSIKITTSGASSVAANVAVTVAGSAFGGAAQSISATSTEYTFTGSSSGAISINWAQSSSKALYFKKIEVTYTTGYTVTFDKNGGTGTMADQTASVATNLTANAFTRTGYTFTGWNTVAGGGGTAYADGASYPFTADVTLYAQWTASGTPTLTASALTAFGAQCTGSIYGPNSFTITGTSLTTANVTVAALSGYTYSTSSGGSYTSTLSLTQPGGAYSQDIYVKFSPASAISYNGNVAVGGGGATSINVVASGTGTDGTPAVSTVTATAITTSTASSGGNTISTTCGTISAKGVVWALTANPTIASNLGITSDGTGTANYTSSITGLSANTLYNYRAYVTNSNGITTYGTNLTFTTLKAEPTNYPTGFTYGSTTTTTIPLSWTDATGATTPDNYLIKWSSTSYAAISAPSDGTAEADGATTKNVAQGAGTYTATGLTSTTTYYFKIWSYTNSGTDINYKLASEPQTSCATITGPCFSSNGPSFSTTGYTTTGDTDAGGSPTNTIRLASSGTAGSIYTTATGVTAGNVEVKFRAKGWSISETNVTVTLDGVSQNVTTLPTSFGEITLNFTSVSANPVLTFSTIAGERVHIGNVKLYCTPACTPPTIQASAFGSSSITTTTATVSWTRGNGDRVLVVAKEASAVNADPVKGTSYTSNAAFGSGSQIGTGNYVLYSGTGTSVNITGLTAGTTYYFAVYEYFDADKCYFDSELTGNLTTVAPTITLSSPNPAVAANNITQGTDNNVIYRFDLAATGGNVTFTNAVISTSGTYVIANITNVKLWYSSDATFSSGSDILLATKSVTSTGNQTFPAFSRVINNSSTGYFFVTTDIPCGATVGNTMIVNAITTGNLTFTSATKTGTANAGGTQTIIGATPINVTSPATSTCENGETTVSWTAPAGCSDNVLIFVKPTSAGAFTMTPTGNGISYTANTTYGSGTAFDGGFCVYKGTGTTVTVTGLTNGINYTYKIFTRNGTTWSSGVTTNCTPNIVYCTAASTNKVNEFIQGVEFNTISNTSAATYYTDYTSSPTTVIKSETYPLSIYNGDYFSSDVALVWVDWNGDGDFIDAGENVFASTSGDPAPYNTNITIPATAITGTVRMRIRLYDSNVGTPNSTPCGTHTYGEVEDYALTIVEPCVPTHTVSTFTPTSGPVGTYVTINGTGFTVSTTVSFGSVASTGVEFISSTKIIAVVPTGATTGKIKISESGCAIKTSSDFTLIKESGSCTAASGYGDLIISEVYDADANNVCYIELYNPKATDINLGTSKYSIKIDNNTGPSPITIDRTINLSGVIASGSTFLINLGTSSNTCNEPWDFSAGGNGINADDNIFLAKNGTDVDRVNTPNNTGYSMLRKSTATAPTTTYSSGDWTISNTESCADLGLAPVITHPNPIVVITNTDGCGLNLSVAVTEGNLSPSGDLTYKWYYNNGVSTGWTLITASVPSNLNISGYSTNNLTITDGASLVTSLDGYQFYCETTEATTCKNVSSATKFRYQSRPVYRSVISANGNWTTVANWEMANTPSGPWASACAYPTSLNSSQAIIQNSSTIILDIDNDIDKLTIETNSTLEIGNNSQLTVYDSTAGADLILNGTMLYRSNSANSLQFDDPLGASKATWTFGSGATLIKTASASADDFREYYEGGIDNIPATGKWIYRYNGDGNPLTAAAGFYYPDLYFENTANTSLFDFNSTTMQLSGNLLGNCIVKGNLFIGTTGIGSVKVYNNNINTSPMLIEGNVTIAASSTLTNQLCSACGAANSSSNNGTGFEIKGNLTNNGTFDNNTASTGITKLSGTGTQTISGGGTFDLWNVELDKPAQTLVDAQVNLTANNNLNFIGGILKTNTNVFTVANGSIANAVTGFETPYTGSSAPSYANDKYVWGSLERLTNTTGIYVYPVGDNASGEAYNPIRFEVQSGVGSTTYATATFIPGDPGTCLVGPIYFSCAGNRNFLHYTDMTGQGKWRMGSSSGTTFGYNVYLHPNQNNLNENPNEDGVVYPLFYRNIYRALKAPNGTTDWSAYVLDGDECTVGNYYNAPGFDYTGFSDFAIPGGTGATTALPVELTSFTGSCIGNGVAKINWSTASELNSRNFFLQRSSDGSNYITVAIVNAAGNSNQVLNYNVYDSTLVTNSNYYRLIEVDTDGKQSIYSFILVECREVDGMNIYYNQPKVVVEINSNTDRQVSFNVYEISGKLLHQENKEIIRGYNRFNLSIEKKLADGIYIIQLIDGKKISSSKLWVH